MLCLLFKNYNDECEILLYQINYQNVKLLKVCKS